MNTARKPAKEVDLRVVLRDSDHNKRARAIIKQYRFSVGMTQAEFAVELSREISKAPIAMTTLSGYESGRSGVPGAVLLAASAIAARVAPAYPPLTDAERLIRLEDAVLYGPAPKRRPSIVR